MPGVLSRDTESRFLRYLEQTWPEWAPILRDKGRRFARLGQRVRDALDGAGYPEAVVHPNDKRANKPGFLVLSVTPDPMAEWTIEVQHYDHPGSPIREWVRKYAAVLTEANIPHYVNDCGVQPHVGRWVVIYVYLPPEELDA